MFRRLYRTLIALTVCSLQIWASAQGQSDSNLWHALDRMPERDPATHWIRPTAFRAFALNHAALGPVLDRAPHERTQPLAFSPAIISLPMPDGTLARFRFVEAPVMAPELAAKFPEIKTFVGQGLDDPLATVRFDRTPSGFHAQILSPNGAVYIDPYFRGDATLHTSYYKRDYRRVAADFQCLTPSEDVSALRDGLVQPLVVSGPTLRTYRLACAATAEYTQFHGGTVASGMAAIVTAVNRITGVYEREVGVRLELVANNDLLVYTSSNLDPYSNTSGTMMLGQNQSNLDSVIGSANYDIGHVFSTGGGGIAGLSVVCVTGRKANGVTGLPSPTGDGFYIDYVAHEMGHQFGANHTFNSVTGSCGGGNRNSSTAYEPGSGSTIMAYAGICGSDDLQPHSDPYFHSVSLDEIIQFTTGGSGSICPTTSPTGNTAPTVSAGPNFTIPRSTPFALTAFGLDPDGDALTFCWEERDLGSSTTLTAADNGNSPLFRSFNATTSPTRTFPKLSNILNNTVTPGEKLPTTARTMNFRVVARDNRALGGGINTANMQVSVATNSGPFVVTSPNSSVTWSNVQSVTWNVAGTTQAPVNAANVDILLSTNGGVTFPITLAANVPNDGSHLVQLPNISNITARIKIQGSGNIFFDVSDADFTIIKAVPAPFFVIESANLASEECLNNAIDPGETIVVSFTLKNVGTTNATNLVISPLGTVGLNVESLPQSYGAVAAGGQIVMPVTFTSAGSCGGTVNAALQLQDGSNNLGTLTQGFRLGNSLVATTSWSNAAPITIPAPGDTRGAAAPYPSTVFVSGITGTVNKVMVRLPTLSHGASDDLDVMLVGPGGQKVLLMSDVGNGGSINNATLIFDDAGASFSGSGSIISGTYEPTNFDNNSDDFSAPAPGSPYSASLAVFNGINPNGTWALYVEDDFKQGAGNLPQGWSLSISTSNNVCCTIAPPPADLVLSQSVAPSLINVGSNLVYTLNVMNFGPATASSVTVTDALPAGASFVSAQSSQGGYITEGDLVCFSLGTMTNGGSATIQITVQGLVAGSVTNRAWVSIDAGDPNTTNNYTALAAAINAPPSISNISDQGTQPDVAVVVPFTINDAETSANALALSATSSDTNLVSTASLALGGNGANRSITITPNPGQTGSALITVTVSDGLASASASFLLTVTPINHAPQLAAIEDRMVHSGTVVMFTNLATDVDPTDVLTFSLPGAPTGPGINSASGVFTWATTDASANTTNALTVRVTDDGSPNLSDEESFVLTILPRPFIQSIAVSDGLVTIHWSAIPGQVYRVQYTDQLGSGIWTDLEPEVEATTNSASKTEADGGAERFYRIKVSSATD